MKAQMVLVGDGAERPKESYQRKTVKLKRLDNSFDRSRNNTSVFCDDSKLSGSIKLHRKLGGLSPLNDDYSMRQRQKIRDIAMKFIEFDHL